ncbi:uncharacterized protein C8R40DRAFT_1037417 [Lentinula edodes]|uniref:uncharacterized protein n=1 Tax=Lentinula edodes TaxID=5353 RepID=UPI001E8DEF9A|nr:uncharacterized protein C8R40DRAFT_1037417 [Lentinula edodes]KAH7878784.1 hypothetical protein C8R40DRAFT_1037417 [Lentinula edodes]
MNSNSSQTLYGTGIPRPLKRGKACLTCRRRCDGARPICGPCQRTPKDDPCEYANGPGRSRAQVLQETVSRLEARLREYEHPEETPSMVLFDPYQQVHAHHSDEIMHGSSSSQSIRSSPTLSFSGTSPLRSSQASKYGVSSGSSDRASTSAESRISLPGTRNLLERFFANAVSFGFFLNHSRFSDSALLPLDFGHQSRPCPGLLSTVYLWGIHLSSPTQHRYLEHTLLMRALRDTASDLSTSNPHPLRFMHTIQAETLLGYYFFRNGEVLQAKRHASSAASLALGCGLNTLRSSHEQQQSSSNNLLPPQDAIEEGERINAFWAVFTLYRDISLTVDPLKSVCGVFDAPGCWIDTPWPLDMDMYRNNILPTRSSSTVYEFLNHIQQNVDEHQLASATNMVTKASLLLHQASFVAGQYYPNLPTADAQILFAAFQSVHHLIDFLRSQLSPLEELDHQNQNLSTFREIYLAHSLIHGSIIRLNEIFSDSDAGCRQNCVKSAQAMIHGGGLNVAEFECVNPIMGTLWGLACQTLVQEIIRLRSVRSGEAQGSWSYPSFQSSKTVSISPFSYRQDLHAGSGINEDKGDLPLDSEDSLLASLQQDLSVLTFFSANSVMMNKSFLSSPLFNER